MVPIGPPGEVAAHEAKAPAGEIAAQPGSAAVKTRVPQNLPSESEPVSHPSQPEKVEEPLEAAGESAPPSEEPGLDADLAITLGKPKRSAAPTGKLSALLGSKSMLVSIDEEKTAEETELSDTRHLQAEYDETKVREAWTALAADLRERNKVGLAATLVNGEFVFSDPTIRFTVANEVQYEELKECAAELLHFVRVAVGSGRIALEVEVSELEAQVAFLSPKDRYLKWAEENPALEVLRKRLDLDLG